MGKIFRGIIKQSKREIEREKEGANDKKRGVR